MIPSNKMFNVLIVDDEEGARDYLLKMLEHYCPEVTIIGQAASVSEAVKIIKAKPPHLVFLDIEMPKENGFELFNKFESIDFLVVFLTAFENYAIKAFKLNALDYLLKPIDPDDLQNVILKALKNTNKSSDKQYKTLIDNITTHENPFSQMSIPVLGGYEFVHLDDIIYLKAESNYTRFIMKGNKSIVATKTLKEFDDVLREFNFHRIHKSNMINMSALIRYVRGDGGMVHLLEGHEVEVSRRAKDGFLEKLNKLLIK